MRSVLQVKRSDWEAFLKQFSEFAKRHELLLRRLDLAEANSKAQDQRVKELSRRNEVLSRELRKATSATTAGRSKPVPQRRVNLTGELRTPRVVAEREVAAVGLVCSCGRGLASGAKFCDRCGRSL